MIFFQETTVVNFQKNFSSLQKYEDPLKDEELEFGDKIYFMIPHDTIIEPSFLIMFELILLDEKLSSTSDRVVAWGAFPLLHRGKCKVPMILGSYDRNVDKFKDIEGKYMKNIDEWVWNIYFETRNVSLIEWFGHKEFLEFPIPSEIQAFLEGKLKEDELKKLRDKDIENKGEDSKEDSKEDEKEENKVDSSREGQEGDFGKIINGEMVLNSSKNLSVESNSDDENKTQYDIEGEDDIIPDLRMVDLRGYKYSIDKKLLFVTDEDEELKKIRYIFKELLLDIGIGRFGLVSTFTSVVIMLLALWSRMYVHYLFQYIALKISDTPVTSSDIYAYRVNIDYGYWNVYQEVISVSAGPLGCTLVFWILILLTWIGHRWIEYFPKSVAKFVVWFGFGTMGDGFMIAIVDTATRSYTGDFFKLPNYYEKAESSSIAGYIVVVVIYIFFVVVNLLLP